MWGVGRKKRKSRKKKPYLAMFASVFLLAFNILRVPAIFSIAGIACISAWFYYSGDYARLNRNISSNLNTTQKKSGIVLANILLDGHKYTPKDSIISAITGTGVYIGYPLLSIDLWGIQNNLEKLTWIKEVAVTRQLPSTLSISVIERQPMALWQNNGKVNIIDDEGEIISEGNLQNFNNLIILVGNNIPYEAGNFIDFIKAGSQISGMVESGILVNDRRWNVKLKNGILIKLPEENPESAWEYLAKKQAESKLLDSNIKTVDLRIEKKMFLR